MSNPFINPGQTHGAVDVASRLYRVKTFSREQCLQALELEHLQKTVEKAVRSRLRKLERTS